MTKFYYKIIKISVRSDGSMIYKQIDKPAWFTASLIISNNLHGRYQILVTLLWRFNMILIMIVSHLIRHTHITVSHFNRITCFTDFDKIVALKFPAMREGWQWLIWSDQMYGHVTRGPDIPVSPVTSTSGWEKSTTFSEICHMTEQI